MFNETVIVIIDDDTWMQRVLTKIITRLDINNIYTAINGFTGINFAIEKKPDVIFLDLMMPDIDGVLTLKMLKAINITKDIPVIIITSNSDFESIGTVLNAGASDFVVKPFTFATIQEKIIKVLTENSKEHYNNQNNNAFDNLGLEKEDTDFFNSFTWEKDFKDVDVTENPPKMNYKNVGTTYKEVSETEINKILKI